MAKLLKGLRDGIRAELARHRNRPFLEAAMAASALVAAADGEISFSERQRMDQVLETLDDLRVFDVHQAVDLFNGFVDAMRDDMDEGVAKALKAVGRIAGNAEAMRLLVRICIAVARADGEFSDPERDRIHQICRLFNLKPAEFDLAWD